LRGDLKVFRHFGSGNHAVAGVYCLGPFHRSNLKWLSRMYIIFYYFTCKMLQTNTWLLTYTEENYSNIIFSLW
jgi:hypothetical protein